MSKQEKSLLTVGIICFVGFVILMTIGLIFITKHENQTRYENPPEINIVEQDTKEYMLNYWYKSNVSLIFIRQEKISDNYIIYYFELEGGLYLEEHDIWKTHYIKAIYKYRNNDVKYKNWFFEKVLCSNYSEAVEVNNNENN